MSIGFNKCMFIGRLGRDPEMSTTQSGLKVGKFSIAVDKKYKDRETTTWINVTTFDKLAEITAQYCGKGQRVFVIGELSIRNFERQDGSKGTSHEVLADQVVFLEKKRDAVDEYQQPTGPVPSIDDDDLPF